MKFKKLIILSVVNLFILAAFFITFGNYILSKVESSKDDMQPLRPLAGFARTDREITGDMTDLRDAARTAMPAVVFVKAKFPAQQKDSSTRSGTDAIIDGMLGQGIGSSSTAEQRTAGSGVIISEDGYIVTNSHVITDEKGKLAPEVMITLRNKKLYKATVVGVDQDNDLAVLRIDANRLPYLVYCNEKSVEPGEWVLATGFPLLLETTVTAGIVSATGKRMMLRRNRSGSFAQPFIQTDAAVNSGSSGGALVNADGELIGIITSIFTSTRNYTGYSFAIPVSVVRKVADQIIEKDER